MGQAPPEIASTQLGNGVYIGPNTVVQMGVTIGDRAVIGAMSLSTAILTGIHLSPGAPRGSFAGWRLRRHLDRACSGFGSFPWPDRRPRRYGRRLSSAPDNRPCLSRRNRMLRGDQIVLTSLNEADRETLFAWMTDADTVRLNAPYVPLDWKAHCRWFDSIGSELTPGAVRHSKGFQGPGHRNRPVVCDRSRRPPAELTIRIGRDADRNKGLGTEGRCALCTLRIQ